MKKILITGTNGFIGSNLKKELANEHKIFEINEDIFDSKDWMSEVEQLFDYIKIDAVFHIGACSDTLEQRVNYMMMLNYQFTKHLMDICKKEQIPLIYSSSAANYGINDLYPSNLYGWSKYAGEGYVISNGGIALRYFNVYGPGEDKKGRMASVAYQMFQKSKIGEQCFLFPKKPTRDFVYVKDVISANIFAYQNYGLLSGKYYEVGSGQSRPFEDVLNLLEIPFEYLDESVIPDGYQFYTVSKEDNWMPDWKPEFNLEKGINDYKSCLK